MSEQQVAVYLVAGLDVWGHIASEGLLSRDASSAKFPCGDMAERVLLYLPPNDRPEGDPISCLPTPRLEC